MKRFRYVLLTILALCGAACSHDVSDAVAVDASVALYPDYAGVTLPANIAPLDFKISDAAESYVVSVCQGADELMRLESSDGGFVIPAKRWRKALQQAQGDSLTFHPYLLQDGQWRRYQPWQMHVSADSIDKMLVYRLIPPLYGTWRKMGIYQRDLESYDQTPIYENVAYHGNCVNCHSLADRNPDRFLFHLRTAGAATYLQCDGERYRLDTKTDSTVSNFTYPYWHPSGRYVAFSVNNIFQVFHTSDPNRAEVIDDASDIVVYDIERGQVFSSPLLKAADRLETFPAFSPDGTKLYFSSAALPDSLPEKYRQVRYSLCAIDFDPDHGTFGTQVDTLYRAGDASLLGSVSFPRVSPDGRWLMATTAEYGNFTIWHTEADLCLYDLAEHRWIDLGAANSDDVESYHSWSSNSRWVVFSSRRDDGLYTRPYIAHIDTDGRVGKPLMLPQSKPWKYYQDQEYSYNIPEFASAPVAIDTRDVVDWISCPAQKVKYRE